MSNVIFCKACERGLNEDTDFCPYCGKKRKGQQGSFLTSATVLYVMAMVMAISFSVIGYIVFASYQALAGALYSLAAALGPVSLFGIIYDRMLKKSLTDAAHSSFSEQSKNVCHNSIASLGNEQAKLEDLIKRLMHISRVGLFAAFPERRYAFQYIADAILSEEKEIYIVGTSFRGLLWPNLGEEKLMKSISDKIKVCVHRAPYLRRYRAFEVQQYDCMPGALHLRPPVNAYDNCVK